jgi:hypothetical protein
MATGPHDADQPPAIGIDDRDCLLLGGQPAPDFRAAVK